MTSVTLPDVSQASVTATPDYLTASGGGLLGYGVTNVAVTPGMRPLSATYYDDYAALGGNSILAAGNTFVRREDAPIAGSYGADAAALGFTAAGLPTVTLNAVLDGASTSSYLWTVSYYDDRARAVQSRGSAIVPGRHETVTSRYDFAGNNTARVIWHDSGGGTGNRTTEDYAFTYDRQSRPLATAHRLDGAPAVTLADNGYDAVGRPVSTARAGNAALGTQVSYNIRSWVTEQGGALFGDSMSYTDAEFPRYGGRIAAMTRRQSGPQADTARYDFCYDAYGRLTDALCMDDLDRMSSYAYDPESNILEMLRDTIIVQYGYAGNRLTSVWGMPCTYDACGRLLTDGSGSLAGTVYNELGLPRTRTYAPWGSPQKVNTTVYSADGAKLRSAVTQGAATLSDRRYVGNLVLDGDSVDRILVDGGYIDSQGRYHFLLTDYRGDVRADALADGTAEGRYGYTPYGDACGRLLTDVEAQPYRFCGNELDRFGWYDFTARQYSPFLGRFSTPDPLAEDYYSISPYAYCAGDPINLVDPNGMILVDSNGEKITYSPTLNRWSENVPEDLAYYANRLMETQVGQKLFNWVFSSSYIVSIEFIDDFLVNNENQTACGQIAYSKQRADIKISYCSIYYTISYSKYASSIPADDYIAGVLVHELTHAYNYSIPGYTERPYHERPQEVLAQISRDLYLQEAFVMPIDFMRYLNLHPIYIKNIQIPFEDKNK